MHNFGYFEEGHDPAGSEAGLWRRLLAYLRPFLLPFGGAVVLSLLVTGASLALPWIMQQAIDQFMTGQQDPAARMTGLARSGLAYGGLTLLGFVAVFLQVMVLEWVGQSIMQALRTDLFSHLISLDLPYFAKHPVGRLVTRLTNDIQNMHEMFTSVIVTLCNDLLRMSVILVLLVVMNKRLGLPLTLFVPLAMLMTVLFSRIARELFRDIRSQLARLNSFLQEALSGVELVRLFGRTRDMTQEFDGHNDEYLVRTLRQIRLFGAFMPLTELMHTLAIAIILWCGGGEIIRERLTLGELTAFLSYMRLFFQPLRELSQKYSIVQSALASAERIFSLLDTRSQEEEGAAPQMERRRRLPQGDLCFERVCFSYQEEHPVLQDVSFTVRHGETVAIVGASGSGKTTLVNLLLRFYEPDSGYITLAGQPLSSFPRSLLRREIGLVMQEMLILQDSLLHNIVLDSGKERSAVQALLEKARLAEFVAALPLGLDTAIGEGGRIMSTGEKQLLAIARVLCREPSLLVLDEASSAIDSLTEQLLEQTLATIFQGKTVLLIAHRLSTVQRADRILVMEQGRIVEQGSHGELLALGGAYSRLVACDFSL